MAGRSTAALLERLGRFLPDELAPLLPLQGGLCAALSSAEGFLDALSEAATLEGADGPWLTLHARGRGVLRGSGEDDEGLRRRLRLIEGRLTGPAILRAVNRILARHTGEQAQLIEHHEAGLFCGDAYLDGEERLYSDHNAFTLVLPRLVFRPGAGDFLDAAYLDQVYADSGSHGEWAHPAYAVIFAEVEQRRAAGVRWWAVLAGVGESQLPYVGEDGFYVDHDFLGDSA